MSYYYWFILKPTPEYNIESLIAGLNPISSSIAPLRSGGGYSCLVETNVHPGSMPAWKSSIHCLSFAWINERLPNYPIPADASCLSLDRFNKFVDGYGLTYAHQHLSLLPASN